MAGPLSGIKILEFTHVIAGPYAGAILADLGADVVKIEDLGHPDEARQTGPEYHGGQSLYYLAFNWGKRSIAVDLSTPGGRRVVLELAAAADVVIDNFRPGVTAKFGIDHASLEVVNPMIITCSITGFGETGPYADRPGYDYTVQAMSGIMSLTGEPGSPPSRAGVAYADHTGGMAAALAICAALVERQNSGHGRHIDLALLEVQVSMLSYLAAWQLNNGVEPSRLPSSAHISLVPAQNFETADGHVSVFAGNDAMWQRLASALGDPRLANPDYATNAGRLQARAELVDIIQSIVKVVTTKELVERLNRAGVSCAPVNSVAQTLADPHVVARQLVKTAEHSVYGAYRHVAGPIPTMGGSGSIGAPELGQDTEAVLRELGYDAERIAGLAAEGAISIPKTEP